MKTDTNNTGATAPLIRHRIKCDSTIETRVTLGAPHPTRWYRLMAGRTRARALHGGSRSRNADARSYLTPCEQLRADSLPACVFRHNYVLYAAACRSVRNNHGSPPSSCRSSESLFGAVFHTFLGRTDART